jgi:hypothetical protein
MERGSAKHSPRQDEALAEEVAAEFGPGGGGSNREEWASVEPPADDDPPARIDLPRTPAESEGAADQDEAEMRRLRHDMEVANDWNPARDRTDQS